VTLSLTDRVVEGIRGQIMAEQVRAGEKLPAESALMELFDVSRTVIREALSRLQAAGLVETYRGKGSYVLTRPSRESFAPEAHPLRTASDAIELLDFRLAVEVEAAALAALRRTDAQLAAMGAALDRFRASRARPSGAVDADFTFHSRIAAATNNPYFTDLLASLGPTMIAMPQTRLADEAGQAEQFDRVIAEHEDILAAIGRKDGPGAHAAMRTHLSNSRARLSRRR